NFQHGYTGPGVITAATVYIGSGQVSIQNGQSLSFTPGASRFNYIRYTVDDKYEAYASVSFPNHLTPDFMVVDQNSSTHQFDVLGNDFQPDPSYVKFKSQDYTGPKLITEVSESVQGGLVTAAPDGLSVYYTPPEDFVGSDSFSYTVDGFMTATATVQVIRRVRDDQFRVDTDDGQQRLPVLVNDLLGADYAGPGHITDVTGAAGGAATIAADGRSLFYTPNAGFVGTDAFTYTVDGALKAEVRVVVDSPATDQSPVFGTVEAYTQFLLDDALVRYQHLFGQTAWVYPAGGGGGGFGGGPDDAGTNPGSDRGHSETNVQVAGVDEGDIVEFDDDYVYTLTDQEVVIVDAWPADELSIASRIGIEGRTIAEFLHGDRLTVISETGGGYLYDPWLGGGGAFDGGDAWWPYPLESFSSIVTVLDVSDRSAPMVVQTTTMEGQYVDSRGVGDFVYVLVSNAEAVGPAPEVIDDDSNPDTPGRYETEEEYVARVTADLGEFAEAALPNYSSYDSRGELVRTGLLNMPEAIHQPLVPDATNLVSVVSFNVEGDEPGLADSSAVYSTGAGAIFASLENFYVFDADHSPEQGAITRVAKFDWDPGVGGVEFAAATTVAGSILNQFSADENGSYLRIATTVSNSGSGNWTGREENMLFVLTEDNGVFEYVGSLQNLALDETMRSVRFLGDRAFVSTFRDVDPLFALDLSDPTNPQSVGHITLPGFTSYMHLVDADHLLTVGRNTPVGFSGPTQVALFDISDLLQPVRTAEYTFERFSTSEAETDHHAFGYFAEHGLLGMPVSRTYYERVDEDGDGYRESRQTVTEFELAVFNVDPTGSEAAQRLALGGEIEHGAPVRRSGYIGDKLYSVASDSVKVVDVTTPGHVIAEVVIAAPEDPGPPPIVFGQTYAYGASDPGDSLLQASLADVSFATAIVRARADLAARIDASPGAAMLVTAEAAPNAPGGGYFLVFRFGERQYLYRASDAGAVALVDGDYQFAGGAATAWHSVDFAIAPPAGIAGDANLDGRVDQQDYAAWQASFGATSHIAFDPADGNGDGLVNSADYTVWRDNLGAVDPERLTGFATADYNRDGALDRGDYDHWTANFGATSGAGLAADGNGDGVVDAADYSVWRDYLPAPGPKSPSATNEPAAQQTPVLTGEIADAVFALPAPHFPALDQFVELGPSGGRLEHNRRQPARDGRLELLQASLLRVSRKVTSRHPSLDFESLPKPGSPAGATDADSAIDAQTASGDRVCLADGSSASDS
ncbi:MAG: beta-propeller domain-containing protein, partial [Planctomycetales bacterium]|nr:beta-propeller domain-containing protein [Planctomycetales bacterium]